MLKIGGCVTQEEPSPASEASVRHAGRGQVFAPGLNCICQASSATSVHSTAGSVSQEFSAHTRRVLPDVHTVACAAGRASVVVWCAAVLLFGQQHQL